MLPMFIPFYKLFKTRDFILLKLLENTKQADLVLITFLEKDTQKLNAKIVVQIECWLILPF